VEKKPREKAARKRARRRKNSAAYRSRVGWEPLSPFKKFDRLVAKANATPR
jgi:hypothetical protein